MQSQRDLLASRRLLDAIVQFRTGWLACGASRVVAMSGRVPGGTRSTLGRSAVPAGRQCQQGDSSALSASRARVTTLVGCPLLCLLRTTSWRTGAL